MASIIGETRIAVLAFILALTSATGPAQAEGTETMHGATDDHSVHAMHPVWATDQGYSAQQMDYAPPNIALLDTSRGRHLFGQALHSDSRPVVFQFIYTTCPGVCPLLSTLMADLENVLGDEVQAVRRWSVSVDPEYDTPERLAAYAQEFGAGPGWRLMTGAKADIEALQKSFDAYQDNKMDHEPSTFVWSGHGTEWLRLDGFVSAEELVAEAHDFIDRVGPQEHDQKH